jgi:hypothetical protein
MIFMFTKLARKSFVCNSWCLVWMCCFRAAPSVKFISFISYGTISNSCPINVMQSPSLHPTSQRVLCLKYYRADSDGWKNSTNCALCVYGYRQGTQRQSGCRLPNACPCRISVRQPTTLFDSALHVYSKMVHSLETFDLTPDTTYDQFVYASTSTRVRHIQLLPPEFPYIRISFRFDSIHCELHKDCPGNGSREGSLRNMFLTIEDAIRELANNKSTHWCQYCSKGLFFPNSCSDPIHRQYYAISNM